MSTGAFKSSFLKDLAMRGGIHQITATEALDAALVRGCVTAYIGFDCTASSLHWAIL
jgi:tyrosyl-tRNA synthetase